MNVIELKDVNKKYEGFQLGSVNLAVEQGTVMGLIGENGAGKTTLIKCIMDLIHYEGKINVFERPLDIEAKEEIGVVLSEGFFSDQLKIREVERIMDCAFRKWDREYFYYLIHEFKIPTKKIKDLSTGNVTKLKIACAMAHHPKLLILDEPTSGLDPVIRDEILDLFFQFIESGDHTVLFSSHILSDLEKIADYITYIQDGSIIFTKNKDDLIYNMGILRATEDEILTMDSKYFVKRRRNKYNMDVLIENRQDFLKEYPDAIVDRPTVEDIMVFYGRGE